MDRLTNGYERSTRRVKNVVKKAKQPDAEWVGRGYVGTTHGWVWLMRAGYLLVFFGIVVLILVR